MKKTKIWFYIFLSLWIMLSIAIMIYIVVQLDNIDEFNLYKQSGVSFSKLKDFCYNATEEQKNQYYMYFNNLIAYPPLGATVENMKQINALSKIAFIHIFNWNWLILLVVIDIVCLVVTVALFFVLRSKIRANKKEENEEYYLSNDSQLNQS